MWDRNPFHDIEQKFEWNGQDVSATSLAEAEGELCYRFVWTYLRIVNCLFIIMKRMFYNIRT